MKLNGYGTYCLYLALKSHFAQKGYDYFKYHGKVSASQDSYLRRRDRYQFEKLARKYDGDIMVDFLVTQILADRTWIGDMLDQDAAQDWALKQKVVQSLSYIFSEDLDKLFDGVENPKEVFKVTSSAELPIVVEKYINGDISLETFVILDHFTDFIGKIDKKMDGHYIWENIKTKATKYSPFLEFDRKKMATILKEKTQ